jgi:uncharacterized membrane protein YkoI
MRGDFEAVHYIRNLFPFVSEKLKEVCVMRKVLFVSVTVLMITAFMVTAACAGGKHKHKHHDHYYNENAESAQFIGREKATSIAYSHAGVTSSDMVRKYDIKIKSKHPDNVFYEIEFVYNRREYEYCIDAITGEIIHWESEWD